MSQYNQQTNQAIKHIKQTKSPSGRVHLALAPNDVLGVFFA
jgi:hypothetical protein